MEISRVFLTRIEMIITVDFFLNTAAVLYHSSIFSVDFRGNIFLQDVNLGYVMSVCVRVCVVQFPNAAVTVRG